MSAINPERPVETKQVVLRRRNLLTHCITLLVFVLETAEHYHWNFEQLLSSARTRVKTSARKQ